MSEYISKKRFEDQDGNPLPLMEVRAPSPEFGDDKQGERIRKANRKIESANTRRAKRNKFVAMGAGFALAAGGVAFGLSQSREKTEPRQEQTASATENKPITLEGIKTQTTEAQMQYVLDHPVTTAEFKTPEEQLTAIGLRMGAIANSARFDKSKPVMQGEKRPFTEAYREKFDAMTETIYEKESSGYDTLHAALMKSTSNSGSVLGMSQEINTKLVPKAGTAVVDGSITTIEGSIIDTSTWSEYNASMDISFTLVTDENGIVRIRHTQEIE